MNHDDGRYRRFLKGDADAFDEIWKEYRLPLTFFINGYLKDLSAAEDVVIDVFTYVLVNPRRYRFHTSLKTYLFMLGRSRALDYLKHHKVLQMTELSEAEETRGDLSLEESVLKEEHKRALHAALTQLPAPMREAVHLVYFEELSYEETAKVMKRDKKQIDNLLYRAKGLLRDFLGKEYGIHEK